MMNNDPSRLHAAGIRHESRSELPPMSELLSWPEYNRQQATDVTERHISRCEVPDHMESIFKWGSDAEPIGWSNCRNDNRDNGPILLQNRWVTTNQDAYRYYVSSGNASSPQFTHEEPQPEFQEQRILSPRRQLIDNESNLSELRLDGESLMPPPPPTASDEASLSRQFSPVSRKKTSASVKARTLVKHRRATHKKLVKQVKNNKFRQLKGLSQEQKIHKQRVQDLNQKRRRELRETKRVKETRKQLAAEAGGGNVVNTRELSDSSLAAALNQPIFHAYGRRNVRTNSKGRYKTHNIGPDVQPNRTKQSQSYKFGYCGGGGGKVMKEGGARIQRRKEKKMRKKKPSIMEKMRDTSYDGRKKLANRKASALAARKKRSVIDKENGDIFTSENDEEVVEDEQLALLEQIPEAEHVNEIMGFALPTDESRKARAEEESLNLSKAAARGDSQLSSAYTAYSARQSPSAYSAPVVVKAAWAPTQRPQYNPKNYKHLPVSWTQMIRPAGMTTSRSESLGELMYQFD